jgi:ADP-ribose pyrophosphatase YjhB (NUDIX family)
MRMALEPLITGVLQRYWRLSRGLTMGAQGMVIDDAGRVLLIRHTYRPGWHFPGGGVERGEPVETALGRELAEETGVEIVGRPELFALYCNGRAFRGDHIALYVVRDWRQEHVPPPNGEIAEQAFWSPDGLPSDTAGGTRRRVLEVMAGRPPDAFW